MALKKRIVTTEKEAPVADELPVSDAVLTVGGKPLPDHLKHLIPYRNTDQGIAEANLTRLEPSGVKVTGDAWDKQMDQRSNATEVWESVDPLSDAVEQVREPGMAYKLLSQSMNSKKGLRRYEIVKAPNGDPISIGNMVLGKMPIGLRDKRNAHYQEKGNADLREARQNLSNEVNKASHDTKGISGLKDGEVVSDRSSDTSVTMGMDRHRGAVTA